MIDPLEVPKNLHSQRERGRLQAPGHRTDDDSMCTLLVIHEFVPRLLPLGHISLPGHPQDRDQICPDCKLAKVTR